MQKLAITEIKDVHEVEPAIIEIVATLQDQSDVILRMNVFVLQQLAAQIHPFVAA